MPRTDATEVLATEITTFEALRPELVGRDLGRFALIKGTELITVMDTENDAIGVGYRDFGNVPFFVRRIEHFDRPATFLSPVVVRTR